MSKDEKVVDAEVVDEAQGTKKAGTKTSTKDKLLNKKCNWLKAHVVFLFAGGIGSLFVLIYLFNNFALTTGIIILDVLLSLFSLGATIVALVGLNLDKEKRTLERQLFYIAVLVLAGLVLLDILVRIS